MTHAYDENSVEYAMDNLGTALDYSVNFLKYDGQEFLDLFRISGIANEFANGNPKYIAGITGRNLADEVYAKCGKQIAITEDEVNGDYSPEYWCGWILAYYQWETGISFKKILSVLTFDMLIHSYGVLHEADISKAVEVFDNVVHSETFLARMRKKRGFSQSELAKAANVSIRSIQLYEQRKNNINNAQYNNLKDIAGVLHCKIEDILEQ